MKLFDREVTRAAAVVLAAVYFVGTGFLRRSDAALLDYSVSDDETAIRLDVGVASSVGRTRGFTDGGGGVKPHHGTFGGLNSPLGAVRAVALEPTPNDTEISFNRPDRGSEFVLRKDAAGA